MTFNHCFHPHIFCTCRTTFIKQKFTNDMLFLDRLSLQRQDDKFVQVSTEFEQLLCNVGLKISMVLCVDKDNKPILPKIFGNYSISKIF